jgi:hypothetical protein
VKAISIRQPYAELVLLGRKTWEYRSRPTHMRGRFYIYVPRQLAHDVKAWVQAELGDPYDVPVQVLVGTIEITDCVKRKNADGYQWKLENPKRFVIPVFPVNSHRAQPGFWTPELDPLDLRLLRAA